MEHNKEEHNGEQRLTRRGFCALGAGAALGMAVGAAPWAAQAAGKAKKSGGGKDKRPAVAMVRDAAVWDGDSLRTNPAAVRKLLDRTMSAAFGNKPPAEVWKGLFKPSDVVGIKVNCLGGRTIATHPDLAKAVADSLIEAGVAAGNIIVWERSDGDLKDGGYTLQKNPGAVRYMGAPELDPKEFTCGAVKTQLCTLITQTCTALIDLPVVKTHDLAGFTCSIKNFLGAVPNAGDFHPNSCEAIADMLALAPIRKKLRLVVVDALRPLCDQGPGDFPPARYKYDALIAGTDPVAIDRVVQDLLEKKRKEKGLGALKDPPRYMDRAAALRLGEADLSKINLITA